MHVRIALVDLGTAWGSAHCSQPLVSGPGGSISRKHLLSRGVPYLSGHICNLRVSCIVGAGTLGGGRSGGGGGGSIVPAWPHADSSGGVGAYARPRQPPGTRLAARSGRGRRPGGGGWAVCGGAPAAGGGPLGCVP